MALRGEGKLGEAIALLQHGLPRVRETLGDHSVETLSLMSNLGAMLIEANRPADAEPHCCEVLQRRLAARILLQLGCGRYTHERSHLRERDRGQLRP